MRTYSIITLALIAVFYSGQVSASGATCSNSAAKRHARTVKPKEDPKARTLATLKLDRPEMPIRQSIKKRSRIQ
jgi:hypothetical protein